MYCGGYFEFSTLSRDHIVPVSRGGRDTWTNVVTACKRCNQRKSNHLLAEISMDLLALPFRPNAAEYLALTNSDRIRGDQMEFLSSQFSRHARFKMSVQ
jgi:5-methylcytosine-specific restriction endonuclease McrA